VPVSIIGLQDADKIGHAGTIAVFGHNRNGSIGRGLAPLPNPQEEIGDVFHGVLSCSQSWRRTPASGAAPLRSIKRKAGGRYAAGLVLQLPARGSGSVALQSVDLIGSTEHLVDAIAHRYGLTELTYARPSESGWVRPSLGLITVEDVRSARHRWHVSDVRSRG